MSELKDKTVKGVFWSAVDRFSAKGIQFVFSILIARLLMPEDYGVIAMLGIFLGVSQSFMDCSTVFYFNIVVAVIFYLGLFFAAPAIADFYNTQLLVPVTRIVALTLPIGALAGIHDAKLSIAIDFKSRGHI